jgi:hypothetical protein
MLDVKHLPAQHSVSLHYRSGVDESTGGNANAASGAIRSVDFGDNVMTLVSADDGDFNGEVTAWVAVGASAVTGDASVPPGVSVTLTNTSTGHKIDLTDGPFSMPTGVGGQAS